MIARDERSSAPLGGLLLAISMFSIVPVPTDSDDASVLERARTGSTLRWLPFVGALLAAMAGATGTAVLYRSSAASLLAATVAVSLLAILSGGLHLDGLADTADGLASRTPRDRALEIMRKSDIGPFGVVALILVLLLDIAALSAVSTGETPWRICTALVVAAATGRLAAVHGALGNVPAARGSGFATLVAGTVSRLTAGLVTAAVLALGALLALAIGANPWAWIVSQIGALVLGWLFRRQVTHHLGGITGDVFGALIELTTVLVLIGLSLS
ncbi:adenosylcobinamide-GDP ribazoletransferase [Jatrophihabitans sp. DSM 45814]